MRALETKYLFLVIGYAFAACLLTPEKALAKLTDGYWEIISSNDNEGGFYSGHRNWDGSKIHFLTDFPNDRNHALTGYFDWTSNEGDSGRENFEGTLDSNNNLDLNGTGIVPPTSGELDTWIRTEYHANLAVSGTQFQHGYWFRLHTDPNFPPFYQLANWSAVQVPEPETYAMLLAGFGLLGLMVRRKKSGNAHLF
jgi:hypothetical protein